MTNLMPFILILASVGMFLSYIKPTYNDLTGSIDPAGKSVQELQSEKKDYTDALEKAANIERVRSGLRDQFNKIAKPQQEQIEKMLPDHIDSVRLIIDINNIAAKYGTSVSNLILTSTGTVPPGGKTTGSATPAAGAAKPLGDPSAVQTATPAGAFGATAPRSDTSYKSIKLGFTISTDYVSLIGFIKELEESLRVVDITSLSFGNEGASSGSSQTVSKPTDPNLNNYTMTIRTYYSK